MGSARFRFYAELNDFLPAARRFTEFEHTFDVSPSIKDAIEGLGVPHTELDLILVDGRSVGLDHRLRDGQRVAVYPMFESVDIASEVRVRPAPLRETRFVCDENLGKLRRYLRLLGFDVSQPESIADEDLVAHSVAERRVLLTRDVGVLKHGALTHGYYVRSDDPETQAIEVLTRFDLGSAVAPFERCAECNGRLVDVAKDEIAHLLEPGTRASYHEFRRCVDCGKIYWKGAHHRRLDALVSNVLEAVKKRDQGVAGGGTEPDGGVASGGDCAPRNRK